MRRPHPLPPRTCRWTTAQWPHLPSASRTGDDQWPLDAAVAPTRTSWRSTCGEMESPSEMNEYGQMAMDHWQRFRPSQYRQIEDPESHFAALGQEAQERATRIEEDVFRSLPTTRDYLQRIANRNQARSAAREIVLADLILPPEAETDPEETDPEVPRGARVDPTGMPTDPNHPLWAALEDDEISPQQFQTRRKAWIDSLPTR